MMPSAGSIFPRIRQTSWKHNERPMKLPGFASAEETSHCYLVRNVKKPAARRVLLVPRVAEKPSEDEATFAMTPGVYDVEALMFDAPMFPHTLGDSEAEKEKVPKCPLRPRQKKEKKERIPPKKKAKQDDVLTAPVTNEWRLPARVRQAPDKCFLPEISDRIPSPASCMEFPLTASRLPKRPCASGITIELLAAEY